MDKEAMQTMKEFEEVIKIASNMNLENLPLDLQFSLLTQYAKLTKAIKNFNEETKKIIVMASILGRS